MRELRSLLLGTALAVAVPAVSADTLKMPGQAPAKQPTEQSSPSTGHPDSAAESDHELSVKMPVRGMTMKQVEKRFGIPQKKLPAVGDPPITRWVYKDYTVYFEYQYVIHAVLNAIPVKP